MAAMPNHNMFSVVADILADIGRAKQASGMYRRYSELSDAELQKQGLVRGGLVDHIFDEVYGRR
jgi:predicted RNA polymerase sigma factor